MCVDVICHGVSSPLLYEKYIEWLQEKKSCEVSLYHFRTKSDAGWGHYGKIVLDKKKEQLFSSNDPYIKAFMTGQNYRECCYECHYANRKRVSDLTLGDFWGIQSSYPELYHRDGVSAVLINSIKGKEWMEQLNTMACIKAVDIEKIIPYQENLQHPTDRPETRTDFYNGLKAQNNNEYMKKKLLPCVTIDDKLHALLPMKLKYAIKRLRKGF